MEKEFYVLNEEDKKIIRQISKQAKRKIRNAKYKAKIRRIEQTLSTDIVKDIINNLPQYEDKTLEEEIKIFKILQLHYYPNSTAKEKAIYLKNFCQEYPSLLDKLSSDITDEEKNMIFNKALIIAEETRQYFIAENIRLVMKLAKQFQGEGLPYQDLIQEGTLGLIRAVDKFDISKQIKFSTYAAHWIKSVIRREIENKSRTIRLPNRVFQEVKKLNFSESVLTFKLSKLPTSDELAKELKTSVSKIEELKINRELPVSLDEPLPDTSDYNYANIVADQQAAHEFEQVEEDMINKQITGIIENSGLDDQEKHILFSYYGFNEDPKAVTTISKELGISRYKVEQIRSKAISQLSQKQELQEIARDCGIIKPKELSM